jgi:phosphohistidine phosphatase
MKYDNKEVKRELLIFRHGKSDWDKSTDDYHRPLKNRGKRGAQRIGIWLAQNNLVPDAIISSPAERAKVTAEKACKAMGFVKKDICFEKSVYLAGVNDLLAVLGHCSPNLKKVMLVGHNPGLEELLLYLCGSIIVPDDGKLLPTATLARLEMPADWSKLGSGQAKLLSITRASTLPKDFPYPVSNSEERRDRPAYYYTQSAVIPYRVNHKQIEILIVSSSNNNHWVVPKGIKDPGLTPQESAAKEAWEEAGVEGKVGDASLGHYTYQKWGAACTVDVYPMEVTRCISEDEWQESHRGREWVTPKEAAQCLKHSELAPMVDLLANELLSKIGSV